VPPPRGKSTQRPGGAWDENRDGWRARRRGGRSALLVVDTGASSTILTPRLLKRLEVVVPADAPRRKLTVVGGEKLDVPFIKIATIAIGEAILKDQEVGVYDINPEASLPEGLLGGDILHRFRVTLDRTAKRMRLEPLSR